MASKSATTIYARPQKPMRIKPLKFGSFDIFYKAFDGTLTTEDVLKGFVELNLHRSVCVTSIKVEFYGEVTFEVYLKSSDKNHGRSRKAQLQSTKFPIKTHKIFEKPSHETAMVLNCGQYVYDFFVTTQNRLPVSFVGDASVRSLVYFCEAVIVEVLQEKNKDVFVEHVRRKPFLLKLPPPKEGEIDNQRCLVKKDLLHVNNILDASGVIAACLILYDSKYSIGDNVRFKVEVFNCFRKLQVDVSLVQRAYLHVGHLFTVVELTLVKVDFGLIKPLQHYKTFDDRCLWIPDDALAPAGLSFVYEGNIERVWYSVLLTVDTKKGEKLLIDIPIVVENGDLSKTRQKSSDKLQKKSEDCEEVVDKCGFSLFADL